MIEELNIISVVAFIEKSIVGIIRRLVLRFGNLNMVKKLKMNLTLSFVGLFLLFPYVSLADCSDSNKWGRFTFAQRNNFFQQKIRLITVKNNLNSNRFDLELLNEELVALKKLYNYGYASRAQIESTKIEIDTLNYEIKNLEFSIEDSKNLIEIADLNYITSCGVLRDPSLDTLVSSSISNLLTTWERRAVLIPDEKSLAERRLNQAQEHLDWCGRVRARNHMTSAEYLEARYERDKLKFALDGLFEKEQITNIWLEELYFSKKLLGTRQ